MPRDKTLPEHTRRAIAHHLPIVWEYERSSYVLTAITALAENSRERTRRLFTAHTLAQAITRTWRIWKAGGYVGLGPLKSVTTSVHERAMLELGYISRPLALNAWRELIEKAEEVNRTYKASPPDWMGYSEATKQDKVRKAKHHD